MITSSLRVVLDYKVSLVWKAVLDVEKYEDWRSDLGRAEWISEKQFVEYTKDGYATRFSETEKIPLARWEFDMENSNMSGHWIGEFINLGEKTEIHFTESVEVKKWLMKPFVKLFLKKQQKTFAADLKKFLPKIDETK